MTAGSHQHDSVEARTVRPVLDPARWLETYGDVLWRFAMSRVRDAELAEELVQEALLMGLHNSATFRGDSSEQTWLLGILRMRIAETLRTRRRRWAHTNRLRERQESVYTAQGLWREGEPGLAHSADAPAVREAFDECLGSLPLKLAEAFVLREVRGLEGPVIVRLLGISAENYWMRLHRARVLLRTCVGRKLHLTGEKPERVERRESES